MDTSLLRRITRAFIGIVFGSAVLIASAGPALAQGGTLVGIWAASITPRNCSTNAALGPPSRALYTYHQDGTVLESPGALLFAPGQRSDGHGTWTQTGEATFTERVVGLLLFETPPNPPASPGFLAGWQLITATITMTDADHFTATGGSQFFDINRQVYRSGCATRVAERFR